MTFKLPALPYAYDALEPYIDATTMGLHHDRHHQKYLDSFNAVLEKYPILKNDSAEDILKNLKSLDVSDVDRRAIQNHGGGYINHTFFWNIMDPKNNTDEKLLSEIGEQFGSVEDFKKRFSDAAQNHFGSGWAWLVKNNNNKLEIYSLPNQDSPLSIGHTPILALDVWEHAYYLKYQNKRPDYIEAWWNVVKLI